MQNKTTMRLKFEGTETEFIMTISDYDSNLLKLLEKHRLKSVAIDIKKYIEEPLITQKWNL